MRVCAPPVSAAVPHGPLGACGVWAVWGHTGLSLAWCEGVAVGSSPYLEHFKNILPVMHFLQYSLNIHVISNISPHTLVFIPQSPLVQAVPPSHITPAKGCSRAGLGAGLPGWAFSSHLSTGFSTRVPVIVRIRKWLADLGKDQPSLKYLRRVAVIQVQHDYTEHVLLRLLSGHWYFLWVCCKLYVPHRSTVHLVSCCTCPKSICHFWNCYLYAIVVSFRMCVQLLFCTFFFFSSGFPYVLACRPSLVFCQMCQQ